MLNLHHDWHSSISVWTRRNITRWFRLFQRKQKHQRKHEENREHWLVFMLTLCTNGFLGQVTSDHLTFLLPNFKSGLHCSRNGCPPVIWIISLYLQYLVQLISITVEFSFPVISITYLSNIIWGWSVPLSQYQTFQLKWYKMTIT